MAAEKKVGGGRSRPVLQGFIFPNGLEGSLDERKLENRRESNVFAELMKFRISKERAYELMGLRLGQISLQQSK